jgi:hypothetical protein
MLVSPADDHRHTSTLFVLVQQANHDEITPIAGDAPDIIHNLWTYGPDVGDTYFAPWVLMSAVS